MSTHPMEPFGMALWTYFQGTSNAELLIRRDDGFEDTIPVSIFFRSSNEFSAVERTALTLCRGHVLDVGAGSGLHSLDLQSRGASVTAIDISERAVEIMVHRGVTNAHHADIFTYAGGTFDTLLMLGHGIGIVENLAGLDRFLDHAHRLVAPHGQMLVHSVDVRRTDDPQHLAYHEANRRAKRYIGTIRIQLEFQGHAGQYSDWLHVDPEVLSEHAACRDWRCETVHEEETGEYLARLTRTAASAAGG